MTTKEMLEIPQGTPKDTVRRTLYPLWDSDRVVATCELSGVKFVVPFRSYRSNIRHPLVRGFLAKARKADNFRNSGGLVSNAILIALEDFRNREHGEDCEMSTLDAWWLEEVYNNAIQELEGEFN